MIRTTVSIPTLSGAVSSPHSRLGSIREVISITESVIVELEFILSYIILGQENKLMEKVSSEGVDFMSSKFKHKKFAKKVRQTVATQGSIESVILDEDFIRTELLKARSYESFLRSCESVWQLLAEESVKALDKAKELVCST